MFVSNTDSKLLDTVSIVSVSRLHVFRLFSVTTKLTHNVINNKQASNAIAKWTEAELTSQPISSRLHHTRRQL